MTLPQEDQLLTMDELAAFLKVSEKTVYRMMQAGLITFGFKVNGTWRFADSDLRAWLVNCKAGYQL